MNTIKNKYFTLSASVILTITLSVLIAVIYSYFSFVIIYDKRIKHDIKTLIEEVDSIFHENQEILKFLGEKIIKLEIDQDLNKIQYMLTRTGELNIKSMTQSYVSWVGVNGEILVSGKSGIVKGSRISIAGRSYYQQAKNHPWRLHLSGSTQSMFSTSIVLPTAMSITDTKGEVKGFLILGLRVNHIVQFLSKKLHDKVHYKIFNQDQELLISNLQGSLESHNSIVEYMESSSFPYSMEVSYTTLSFLKAFICFLAPRLSIFFIFLCPIFSLYAFKKQIIIPISEVSEQALSILSGNYDIKFNNYKSKEVGNLVKILKLIAQELQFTQKEKDYLAILNDNFQKSDKAKNNFLQETISLLNRPLHNIALYSATLLQMLKKQDVGMFSKHGEELIKRIYNNISIMKSRNIEPIHLERYDLLQLLRNSIEVVSNYAFSKNIRIELNYNIDIKNILIDELKLKMVIVSLLNRSIDYSLRKAQILVSVSFDKGGNLSIIIEDFGLHEEDVKKLEETIGIKKTETILDSSCLSLDVISEIVHNLKGSINVSKKNKGSITTLIIPVTQI